MKKSHLLKLVYALTPATAFIILIFLTFLYFKSKSRDAQNDAESPDHEHEMDSGSEAEDFITFSGAEGLTISDILDAPGEVIGKSSYGTLYKAVLEKSDSVMLLRFLRPACTARVMDFDKVVELMGCIRHQNLVPLLGFYAGPRGEKLLVHPFYGCGNLSQFIRCRNGESNKWSNIYRITIGIARALDHLHNGLDKPVVHGNLKSKNILLDQKLQPHVSDFALHLILNPTAGQEMLEASASEGYKAPELIKMKDVAEETDIYSFGVIMLELVSGKEPVNDNPSADEEIYLAKFMRNAVLDHRISDLYCPDIVLSGDGEGQVTEERVLKFFQLAMACCSPSPSLRPNVKQVLRRLEGIAT